MRGRRFTLLATPALLLCLGSSAHAQVFDLSGGASTLYGAEGASVVIHGGGTETSIGAGLMNGRFGVGASSTRAISGGSLTAGQQQFSMELPTDIFGCGQVLSGSGLGLRSQTSSRAVSAFVGFSAAETGTPLFQSTSLQSPTAYMQWKQPIGDSLTSSSTALVSTRTGVSFLQSLSWAATPHAAFAVTAGVGGDEPYGAASLVLKQRTLDLQASYVLAGDRFQRGTDPDISIAEPIRENISAEYRFSPSLTLSALRRNYFTPVTPADAFNSATNAVRSSLDDISAQYRRDASVFTVSLLHSRSDQEVTTGPSAGAASSIALTLGFSHKIRGFEWSENFYDSIQKNNSADALLVNGLALNVNAHLRLTESVNISANGPNFSHGGALVTRFSSFEVDYQLLYLATRPAHPFQQAMVFDSRIRVVRDLWLQASSSIGPTGTTLYTFRTGTQFSRTPSAPAPLSPASFGISILRGRVVDEKGTPVEGAALKIDSTQLFTDAKGFFFFREKTSRVHPFTVSLEDFMQLGQYTLVSAPRSVRTALERDVQPVTVVVSKLPNPAPDSPSPPSVRRPLPPEVLPSYGEVIR